MLCCLGCCPECYPRSIRAQAAWDHPCSHLVEEWGARQQVIYIFGVLFNTSTLYGRSVFNRNAESWIVGSQVTSSKRKTDIFQFFAAFFSFWWGEGGWSPYKSGYFVVLYFCQLVLVGRYGCRTKLLNLISQKILCWYEKHINLVKRFFKNIPWDYVFLNKRHIISFSLYIFCADIAPIVEAWTKRTMLRCCLCIIDGYE